MFENLMNSIKLGVANMEFRAHTELAVRRMMAAAAAARAQRADAEQVEHPLEALAEEVVPEAVPVEAAPEPVKGTEPATAAERVEEDKPKSAMDVFASMMSQVSGREVRVVQGPPRGGQPLIGRNDPCPCGSGKKYKKCCGKGQF